MKMKNMKLKIALSPIVQAAPVDLYPIVQLVNTKPGKPKTGDFTQLNFIESSGKDFGLS